jgi:hypothetical protein
MSRLDSFQIVNEGMDGLLVFVYRALPSKDVPKSWKDRGPTTLRNVAHAAADCNVLSCRRTRLLGSNRRSRPSSSAN